MWLVNFLANHMWLPEGNPIKTYQTYSNICPFIYTMWGPRSIAKLVNITPITMVYGTQISIVFLRLLFTNVHITGGPHIPTYQSREPDLVRGTGCFSGGSNDAAAQEPWLSAMDWWFQCRPSLEWCSWENVNRKPVIFPWNMGVLSIFPETNPLDRSKC